MGKKMFGEYSENARKMCGLGGMFEQEETSNEVDEEGY